MVITVTCSSCSSSFPVDPAKIPAGGVNARCSFCGNVFRVEKPAEAEPQPMVEAEPTTRDESLPDGGGAATAEVAASPGDEAGAAEAETDGTDDIRDEAQPDTEIVTADADEDLAGSDDDHETAASPDHDDSWATEEADEHLAPDDGAPTGDTEERVDVDVDVVEGVAEADAGGSGDWVVEHEEVPEMEPDPLPPIDDRLPEIPDQAEGETFERSTEFEGSMEFRVEPMEIQVEVQTPVTEDEAEDGSESDHGPTADDGTTDEAPADEAPADEAPANADDEGRTASEHAPARDEVPVPEGPQDEGEAVEPHESADGPGTAEAPVADKADKAEEEEPSPQSTPVQGFTFGKRDPTDKAKRLARVLVSDMIMYNAERHQSALAAGTLVQDFEEEIEKSWKEYVDQVGAEMANGEGREYWTRALNDILAKGDQVF